MFERYTESARRALFFARYEVTRLGATSIETEHLLLGVMRENKGLAAQILAPLPQESIRRGIDGRSGFREKISASVEVPFSAETKRVLNFAAEEADRLLHSYIGPEHLVLALLREENSVAASILTTHGLRLDDVRLQIVKGLGETATPSVSEQIDRIKNLVEQLGRTTANTNEARELVGRIGEDLDGLKRCLGE